MKDPKDQLIDALRHRLRCQDAHIDRLERAIRMMGWLEGDEAVPEPDVDRIARIIREELGRVDLAPLAPDLLAPYRAAFDPEDLQP